MYEFRNDMPMYPPYYEEELRHHGIDPLAAGLIGAGLGFIGGGLFAGGPNYGPGFGPGYGPGYGPGFYGGYPMYGPGYGYYMPGYNYNPY